MNYDVDAADDDYHYNDGDSDDDSNAFGKMSMSTTTTASIMIMFMFAMDVGWMDGWMLILTLSILTRILICKCIDSLCV